MQDKYRSYFHLRYILSMSKAIVFGYWKFRGLGQYLRLLLAYSELEFEQVQYDSREEWFGKDKQALGFDFPNLPYLIDGNFKLTESTAIAKYIAKRSGKTTLLGKNPEDAGKVYNIIGALNDALLEIRGLFWEKDYQNLKISLLEKARHKLNTIKSYVGENEFAVGYLTIADFHLAENLYYFETLYPSEKDNYAFWWRIRHNFERLPEIKAYYQRQKSVKGPFIPSLAVISPKFYKVKLAYWGVRFRGQIPRLLLAYSQVDFEDYHYTNRDLWFKEDKLNKGLNFPNLPYLVDGQYNITEANAIQRYICNRWGKPELLGKNIKDAAQLERFLCVWAEISDAVKGLCFNSSYQILKAEILEKNSAKIDQIVKYIDKNNFVLGYLTLADFVVAEDSYYFEAIYPDQYKQKWSCIQRIRNNFNSLPQIMAYYKSTCSFKGQFLPPNAVLKIPLPESKA